jgi:hypothetical protein
MSVLERALLTTLIAAAIEFGAWFIGIPAAWTHTAPLLEHWLEPTLLAEDISRPRAQRLYPRRGGLGDSVVRCE